MSAQKEKKENAESIDYEEIRLTYKELNDKCDAILNRIKGRSETSTSKSE